MNEKILRELRQTNGNICTDSRLAKKGDLFFALKGERFDGNQYAKAAIEAGCVLAVIDNAAFAENNKYLVVDDALSTLQQLAKIHRGQINIPHIAITGSNGKTTTKELVQAVLSSHFRSMATKGNLNNHIGVPVTLLSIKEQTEIAVVEMGANHPGEIAALCEIATPTHGLITNIGKAHLEGFGSVENIAKAKGELFDYLKNNQGVIFANHDDPRLLALTGELACISYGKKSTNHCFGSIINSFPTLHIRFNTSGALGKTRQAVTGEINTHLTGSYNFENVMAAVTVGVYFGVPVEKIIAAIEAYRPVNHRSQLIETADNFIVMDAYNANPTSMAAALDNFSNYRDTKLAVMLGDMLELGSVAEAEHTEIVNKVKKSGFPIQIFVGKHFMGVCKPDKQTMVFPDVNQAAEWLENNPLKGYRILIKGSRGIMMESLLRIL
ncbi:MAG: UDP-N-acetylmuramoyl-tripeptide--D-alanyl-D-alanine ligase [Bacteroidia bacterium]|nr:MAG: UDP-N-acetylmuramoyl-tripeptide--D-alanyl-D-alanine ligase [Bacteroidia bacterium]